MKQYAVRVLNPNHMVECTPWLDLFGGIFELCCTGLLLFLRLRCFCSTMSEWLGIDIIILCLERGRDFQMVANDMPSPENPLLHVTSGVEWISGMLHEPLQCQLVQEPFHGAPPIFLAHPKMQWTHTDIPGKQKNNIFIYNAYPHQNYTQDVPTTQGGKGGQRIHAAECAVHQTHSPTTVKQMGKYKQY